MQIEQNMQHATQMKNLIKSYPCQDAKKHVHAS